MILTLLGMATVLRLSAAWCPCTVQPGQDSLSRTTLVHQARRDAYAVLLGKVVRADTMAWDTLFLANSRRPTIQPRLVRYRLEAVSSWKGPRQNRIEVLVHLPSMSCGRSLELHQEYLLFAYASRSGRGQDVEIDACSRVELKGRADSTIAILGRARNRPRSRRAARIYFSTSAPPLGPKP